jgi:dihydrolipoamide dehydrogenase
MPESNFDLIVIGAGPGGYVCAIRAAQLGLKTAIIEKEDALGGTCLRVGCIPSKALLESSERFIEAKDELSVHGVKVSGVELDLAAMLKRKERIVTTLCKGIEGLMKKNKIERFKGTGKFTGPGAVSVEGSSGTTALTAKHVVIATGSKVAPLRGVEVDNDRIGTSTTALSYTEVPKHLIVIGAGVIGLELGSVWGRLGAKVTVLEYLDRILPGMDNEIAAEAQKILTKQGFTFKLGVKVKGAKTVGNECIVEAEGLDPVKGDRVLLATGRLPNTDGLGLEAVGITPDKRGRIETDKHWRTATPGIYAIGDVIAGPMLAHKAEDEGSAVAQFIATGYGHVNYDVIPGIVYTNPEIAAVGKTEEELKAAGVAYKSGKFPMMANGRAKALNATDGWVKMLADAKTDRVLGVHIIASRAGDLIAECAVAMEFGASSEDIARACHAHPTLSETVKEAAMAVTGRAVHM